MDDYVFVVAIVFGSVVAIAWMIINAIMRSKERARASNAEGAVGLRELEERIQRAVEAGIEPLRLQVGELEEAIRSRRELPTGEWEGQLLRSHEEE